MILLLAVAGGAAVGNLYWAQPLLDLIARDLHTSTGAAGWLVTATQLGYALGVFLIVPLGDMLDRRRLIPAMLLLSAVALGACAAAPTFTTLLGAIAVLGITTVSGQIIVPLAGDMADPAERGRVVGTVTSGVLTGILVSRTVSGLVAGAAGWRVIYAAAAVVAVLLAALLAARIPTMPARPRISYGVLLASIGHAIAGQRTIRWSLVLGATQFGLFTMFWTALTFYLSAAPYDYSVTRIGLFGLFGLAGALAAQRAGRLHDRGWSLPASGAAWLLVLIGFGLAGFARTSLALLIAAIVVLDIAIQSLNILNGTRLFAVAGDARSRVNTAMVTANFIAGAIGSAAAGVLWSHGGWTAVTTTEILLAAFGFVVWLLGRRGPLVVPLARQAGGGAQETRAADRARSKRGRSRAAMTMPGLSSDPFRTSTPIARTIAGMTETMSTTNTAAAPAPAPPPQVWPTLRATNARALIAFLVEAFGFIEVVTYGDQPDGSGEHVVHAQLAWPEGGGIMLGSARTANDGHPADPWALPPGSFGAYVVTADPTALHARAVAAGATITEGIHETDYGSTDFAARDPEGNRWSFGTYAGEPVPKSG